jgi:hypothetical protein
VVSQLVARSISRPVWEHLGAALPAGQVAGQMVAVLDRTCVLAIGDGELGILAVPEIGDGPLNLVVDGNASAFSGVEVGLPVWLERGRLVTGQLEVRIDGPSIWEPRPDWDWLRASCEMVKSRIPLLRTLAQLHGPEGSLLAPFLGPSVRLGSLGMMIQASSVTALQAAEDLLDGWQGNPVPLQMGARRLAGLGGGLTPSGDDFLCGVMLWAWLAHPTPHLFCHPLLEAASGRTTALSAAFLRAAARGECSAAWHRLLAALAGRQREQQAADACEQLEPAVRDVLSFGRTSGGDTLAGFLWMGCQPDCR